MDIVVLLPLILLIVAMFVMTRSAKKKQQQVLEMRDQVQPGTGIRTIGGLYARVKEVSEDTVLLELAPGVHAHFAKNAIGAVLEDEEYDGIVSPQASTLDAHGTIVPDDASSLTESSSDKPNLVKGDASDDASPADRLPEDAEDTSKDSGVDDVKKDDDAKKDDDDSK